MKTGPVPRVLWRPAWERDKGRCRWCRGTVGPFTVRRAAWIGDALSTLDDVAVGCGECDLWLDGEPLPLVDDDWPGGVPLPPPWPTGPVLNDQLIIRSGHDPRSPDGACCFPGGLDE